MPPLSIIIPAWREPTAGSLVDALREQLQEEECEIILALAEGDELTSLPAESSLGRLVRSSLPGRAAQMNRGAAIATGDNLLFLHADTTIERASLARVGGALADATIAIGAFRFASGGEGWRYRLMERLVAMRCRLFKAPYGDQALFMRRALFERVGGYDESLPLFEELRLVEQALRHGRLAMIPDIAITSPRRYEERGFIRTTLRHLALFVGYALGIDPRRLATLVKR